MIRAVRGRENLAEAARVPGDVRRTEVRVVERVEDLGPELEGTPVRDLEVLGEREVEVGDPGTAHDPDAGVAERLRRRLNAGERVGVEPARQRALGLGQLGIADQVRPRPPLAAEIERRSRRPASPSARARSAAT